MSKLIDYPAEEFVRLHEHLRTIPECGSDSYRIRFASQHIMDFIGDLPILDEVLICDCAESGDIDGINKIIKANPDVSVYPNGNAPRHDDNGWRMKSMALETAHETLALIPASRKSPKQIAISRASRPMFLKRYSSMPLEASEALLKKQSPERSGICDMMDFYRDGISARVGDRAADYFMSKLTSFMRSSIGRRDEEQRMLTLGYILQYLDVVRLATKDDRVADGYSRTIIEIAGVPENDGSDQI